MDRVLKKAIQTGLMLFDCIAINLMIPLLIFLLQKHGQTMVFNQIIFFSVCTNFFWLFIFNVFHLYHLHEFFEIQIYVIKLFSAMLLLFIIQLYLLYNYAFSSNIIIDYSFAYLILISLLGVVRIFYIGFRQYLVLRKKFFTRAIIIGYNNTAKKLAEYLQNSTGVLQLVGYVDDVDKI